jgi:hypothetical protein
MATAFKEQEQKCGEANRACSVTVGAQRPGSQRHHVTSYARARSDAPSRPGKTVDLPIARG